MRIFKTRTFSRWVKRAGLANHELIQAVLEIQAGLIDARLGRNVIKKRIKRSGRGMHGGYRTILATNYHDRCYFMFGFAKNERDNIEDAELRMLQQLSTTLLAMDVPHIEQAVLNGALEEIFDGQ
jgi:hypothetical protein